jgi:uncharacterized membrane protein HdeD (DUF308 family)
LSFAATQFDARFGHRASDWSGVFMIVLGIILLVLGFVFLIPILKTLGIILLVIGAVFFVLGRTGRPVAGRRYWY